ncbi:hypothetical protein CTI12_AA378690 [Artemisia annua]|uniref:Uncharacterized protein n=1 Tax=Artemisia annua TaxID=35608 RepID=A0A2U1MIN2_ARTAN|nr:hypothetical protein CTI12_AA378690 [Artemisia annua]
MAAKTSLIEQMKLEVNSHKMPKLLFSMFEKERNIKRSAEKEYSKKIGEMNIHLKKRGDVLKELEFIGCSTNIFKEYYKLLKAEHEEDMKEIDSLVERRLACVKRIRKITTMQVKLAKMEW